MHAHRCRCAPRLPCLSGWWQTFPEPVQRDPVWHTHWAVSASRNRNRRCTQYRVQYAFTVHQKQKGAGKSPRLSDSNYLPLQRRNDRFCFFLLDGITFFQYLLEDFLCSVLVTNFNIGFCQFKLGSDSRPGVTASCSRCIEIKADLIQVERWRLVACRCSHRGCGLVERQVGKVKIKPARVTRLGCLNCSCGGSGPVQTQIEIESALTSS